jgi:aldose 1-epimerase
MVPSGSQLEIRHGELRAVVVEVGGGLRSLSAGDFEVLDGFEPEDMCQDARGHLMIPWPNRISRGRFTFEGRRLQLPVDEPELGNAIHGLVRWVAWTATRRSTDSVTLSYRLYPQPGYPFALDMSATYLLDDSGLNVSLEARNIGATACPFGAGQHPYLRLGHGLIDECFLRVPARTIYLYDERLIPVTRTPVESTPLDFRSRRSIGATEINMDYTDLIRDGDGYARVLVEGAQGQPRLELWMDRSFRHVTIYTGETVHPSERRRHGLAVEPMTCPPNAFVSGENLIVLGPGEEWQGSWGIRVALAEG